MSRDEVRKLLGGYATGTLTDAEQQALFAAALEDQELFEELAREQPVRDLLRDPGAKAELLAALDGGARQAWWQWRPLIAGVAMAGIAMVAVVTWRGSQSSLKTAPVIVAELKRQEMQVAVAEPAAAKEREAAPGAREKRRDSREKPKTEKDATVSEVRVSSGNVQPAVGAPPPPPPKAETPARPAQPTFAAASPPIDQVKGIDQVKVAEAAPAAPGLPFRAKVGSGSGGGGRIANQAGSQGQQGAVSQIQTDTRNQTIEVSASMALLADKKAAAVVQCTILRGESEVPAEMLLNASETVRLRIVAAESGRVSLVEGQKVLVSSQVEASKAFDTPALPFAGSGARELRVVFLRGPGLGGVPVVMPLTIRYR